MAIVYKKSELGTFLEQLPSLIMNYQAQIADREREERLADRRFEQEVLLTEKRLDQQRELQEIGIEADAALEEKRYLRTQYEQKLKEMGDVEALFDEFPNLNPEDVTSGAPDITFDFLKSGEAYTDDMLKKTVSIDKYIGELESAKRSVEAQVLEVSKLLADPEWAGPDMTVVPEEFEELKEYATTSVEEGGLGYQPSALDKAYSELGTPTELRRLAYTTTEALKKVHISKSDTDYKILQGLVTPGDDEDMGDVLDKFAHLGEPANEKMFNMAVEMLGQGHYSDFIKNLYRVPGKEGEKLREFFATNGRFRLSYGNLKTSYGQEVDLENELLGLSGLDDVVDIDKFKADIEGLDIDVMVALYDTTVARVRPEEHAYFWKAMEDEHKSEDLDKAWKAYKGIKPKEEYSKLEEIISIAAKGSIERKDIREKEEDLLNSFHDLLYTPGDWDTGAIGSIARTLVGVSPDRTLGLGPSSSKELEENIKNLSAKDMHTIETEVVKSVAGLYEKGYYDELNPISAALRWALPYGSAEDAQSVLQEWVDFENAWENYNELEAKKYEPSEELEELKRLAALNNIK